MAVKKRAAMHEHHGWPWLIFTVGHEDVEHLSRMRAVSDVAPDRDAVLWRLRQHLGELLDHQLDMAGRVGSPFGADFCHQGAQRVGNCGKSGGHGPAVILRTSDRNAGEFELRGILDGVAHPFAIGRAAQRGLRRRWICMLARNGTNGCAPILTMPGTSSLISASRCSPDNLNLST